MSKRTKKITRYIGNKNYLTTSVNYNKDTVYKFKQLTKDIMTIIDNIEK